MAVLKHSRQRDAIMENLRMRKDHPTADMVFSDIRKVFPNISLGTVYRNLALLTDIGEIQKLTPDGIADRYDGNPAPHNHFICRSCGSVLDLDGVDEHKLEELAGKNFDGVIESCSVNFYGVCGTCRRENAH
ncbi:MAG: transcriptional repressor [Eubacterium sp.]|jgi:Fur family peroxide stress response transcriptional regulator|nr:transcriptional repressor [Eubacterium sp.]